MLLCIDCLEGLCLKCIKQGSHHNHKLEELADAKVLLKPKFDKQIQNELSSLDAIMTLISASAFSVAEISQAETDMKTIFDQVESIFAIWKGNQELVLTGFKQEAINHENEIQAQREELKSLLEQKDIGADQLITKLKEPHSFEDHTRRFPYPKEAQDYSFTQHAHTLLESLQSVLHSRDTISSKFFKEAFDVKPKDAQHPRKASRDVAIDTAHISESMQHTHNVSHSTLPSDVKPKSIGPEGSVKSTKASSETRKPAEPGEMKRETPTTADTKIKEEKTPDPKSSKAPKKGDECKQDKQFQFHKVVRTLQRKKDILICRINDDIIFYNRKTHACKFGAGEALTQRSAIMWPLRNFYDIQKDAEYKEDIKRIREYYLSLKPLKQ